MNTKLPPHDITAEEAVCGSLIIDGSCMDTLIGVVEEADFYADTTKHIFAACRALYERGEPIDQITLAHELEKKDLLAKIGGSANIAHLMTVVPTSLDAEYYGEIVAKTAACRRLITAGNQIAQSGYNADADIDVVLSKADEQIMSVRKTRKYGGLITPMERGRMMMERYTQLFNGEHPPLLRTGLTDVDFHLGGGFTRGELVLIVADSGVGKSTLAHQIAIHNALSSKVLYCLAEMTPASFTDREIAAELAVPVTTIRQGHYTQELYEQIMGRGIGSVSQREVYLHQEANMSVAAIREKAKQAIARYGEFSTIVVDYLQLIEPPKGSDNRYLAIGDISRHLSALAKELNVLVILLCQLSRAVEQRENKRPTKSDIYESKRPEQDADFILSLYRIDRYWDEASWYDASEEERRMRGWSGIYGTEYPANIAEIGILKDRISGENKIIKVYFDPHRKIYANLQRGTE